MQPTMRLEVACFFARMRSIWNTQDSLCKRSLDLTAAGIFSSFQDSTVRNLAQQKNAKPTFYPNGLS